MEAHKTSLEILEGSSFIIEIGSDNKIYLSKLFRKHFTDGKIRIEFRAGIPIMYPNILLEEVDVRKKSILEMDIFYLARKAKKKMEAKQTTKIID